MNEPWFFWALTGVICIGLEMFLPGFVIFFFGVGGLLTSLLSLMPIIRQAFWFQILIFLVFSTASLVFFRKRFAQVFKGSFFDPNKSSDVAFDGIGEIVEVIETISPPSEGRIRFRGSTWKAKSSSGILSQGEKVKILGRENVTYLVEKV